MSYPRAVGDNLNMHFSGNTSARATAWHMLDTLVAVDPSNGDILPHLAEEYEVSDDGLEYTFNLRDGVTFHDGEVFNAEAVKFNFDTTMSATYDGRPAQQSMGADKYEGNEVIDELTIKVTFNTPHPAFLVHLSDVRLGFDSPKALEEAGEDYGITTVVGTGPFKFVEWVEQDRVVMEPNPDYNWPKPWAKHSGPPLIDELIFQDIAENATRAAALQNGDVQVAALSASQAADFEGSDDVEIILVPKAGTTRMYLMNIARPPTDDIEVRRAIIMGIDKEALLSLPAWGGIGRPGLAPLPSNVVPNGDLSSLEEFDIPYNPEEAAAILDAAGWTMGSGEYRMKDGVELVVDFVTTDTDVPQVEPVVGLLREIGVRGNMITGDFQFSTDVRSRGEFNMSLSSSTGYDAANELTKHFYSEGAFAYYGIESAEIDAAIDGASNAVSRDVYWENVFLAMELILQLAVGSMAFEEDIVYGAGANVRDVAFTEIGFPYFYDVWLEEE